MNCKLMSGITKENCQYSVAGIKAIYLYNYDPMQPKTVVDGQITSLVLPEGEKAHKVDFISNTASFTDELAENGNGGKYRTQTLNFSLNQYKYEMMNQADALSVGRFTAIVVDKADRAIVLGYYNGLNATACNYESGAADADANGWTVTLAGSEISSALFLSDEARASVTATGARMIITE